MRTVSQLHAAWSKMPFHLHEAPSKEPNPTQPQQITKKRTIIVITREKTNREREKKMKTRRVSE